MEVQIKIEKLRKRKLFVATPMYGGHCTGIYCQSTNKLSMLFSKYNIELEFFYLYNESLVTRARNICCDAFLRSGCTHMIFIDSDIGFDPNDVVLLLALLDHEDKACPYDIVCGPYPKKRIVWEKIKRAVEQGYADDDANKLSEFASNYVFSAISGSGTVSLNDPVEVSESGTGFMMFTKKPLHIMKEAYPELLYRPDDVGLASVREQDQMMAYFDTVICPETKRYLSEDFMFCQWIRKLGVKIWLCPWMKLNHVGGFTFTGDLSKAI